MSYYGHSCGNWRFTPTQYDVIRKTAEIPFRTQLNAPPQKVIPPSNLKAIYIENTVNLYWQDNATNEIGYFIEQSLFPDSGFVCVGAAYINATDYYGINAAPNTHYYYRIRAANSIDYSQSISIKTDYNYCKPVHQYTCYNPDSYVNMNSLVVNTDPVYSNSTRYCNSYTLNYEKPINLHSESTYPFTIAVYNNRDYNPQNVLIWMDLNCDGVFDETENLFDTTVSQFQYFEIKSTIKIPKIISSVRTKMRIRISWEAIKKSEPCSDLNYGETEDYVVNISGSGLGLEDESKIKGLSFYPNPSDGTIYLKERFKLVEVIDITGLVVFSIKPETKESIDLTNLNNGAYLIRTTDFENKTSFNKLIIEK